MKEGQQYTSLSRGFSCEVCDRGYAHQEVSHDGGETWVKVCDECYLKEMAKGNERIWGEGEL
jgi:hypothetical protein